MRSIKFDNIVRSALLSAHKNICFYCQKPLEYEDLEIDHIVPAHLNDDEQKFEQFKIEYALNQTFDLNSFYNLVPTHSKCNLRKSGEPFNQQNTRFFLELACKKITQIENEIQKLYKRRNKGTILSKSRAALAANLISVKEFEAIIKEARENEWLTKGIKIPMPIEFIDEVFDSFYMNNECSELYDKTLLLGKTFSGLELMNDQDLTKTVSTLREWKTAISEGFYANSTFAIKISESFTFLDDLIQALHKALMPRVSFISEPWIGIDDVDYLSPNFIYTTDGKQPKFDESTSVGELIRKGTLIRNPSNHYQLALEFEGAEIHLIEQFRADFNQDGIEDIFVRGWSNAVGGSFGMGFTTIFTRRSEKHLIEEIRN